jgi:hypothetical protein
MILDLFGTLMTQPLVRVLAQQSGEKAAAFLGDLHIFGKLEVSVDYPLEHLALVAAVEGRTAIEHLEDEDAESPPVDGASVSLVQDNLRACIDQIILR